MPRLKPVLRHYMLMWQSFTSKPANSLPVNHRLIAGGIELFSSGHAMTQPCCPPTQSPAAISKQADSRSQRVVLVQDASCACECAAAAVELRDAAVPAIEPPAPTKHHHHKQHRSKSGGGSARGGAHHHKHQQQDASAAVTVTARCHSCCSGTSPASSSSGSMASAASGGQGAAAVGDGRAKSFTAGYKAAHHQHARLGHHSGCGQQARSSSGSRSASPNSGSGRPAGHAKHQQLLLARHIAADINARAWSPVKQAVLLAESVERVEDIGKGFALHWYNGRRQLRLYDGSKAAAPAQLLKHVPQTPGLHLWLVRPPCSRQWVPVHLAAAANLQQSIASYLHADGSCGPVGSKQKVLLDLQCRGFAVAVRYRPLKPGAVSVQGDLLAKLQHFDFALNDVDNAGCRPLELPNGRPVASYPLVAVPMMHALYDSLFGPRKLL